MYAGLNNIGLNQNNLFSPQNLFTGGEQGAFYDPNDLNTLYQDSAGTTPVTAVGQPVGLILDKRLGAVRGGELVTPEANRDFSSDTGYWTKGTGWTIGSGVASANGAPSNGFSLSRPGILTVGQWYEVTLDVPTLVAGELRVWQPSGAAAIASTAGSGKRLIFQATQTELFLLSVNFDGTVDNVSLKAVAGNHASQATAASRPTLSGLYNRYISTEDFSNAYWTKERVTITTDAATAPNGTLTADKVEEDATSGYHDVVRNLANTLGVPLVYTVRAKAAERSQVHIRFTDLTSGGQDIVFDLTNVAVVATSGSAGSWTGISSSITALGDGWYQCKVVATPGAGTNSAWASGPSTGNAASYAGSAGSGVYLWGADIRTSADAALSIPAYQRVTTSTDYDTMGFPLYLSFDGTDDSLATGSIDFSATDKMTVWAGVNKQSDAAIGALLELSADSNANNGTFAVFAPASAADNVAFRSKGTVSAQKTTAGEAAPVSLVLTGLGDISGDVSNLRIDGVAGTAVTTDQGTGNFGNYPLYIGSRGGSSLPFNGRLYSLVIRGATSASGLVSQTERWVGARMGINL